MGDNSYDVILNGVKYLLAEDAEGEHFIMAGRPLRPPNAVQVQGENNKFQMRPDRLLWSLTDWSGGEGQQKFDPQNPNRWRELDQVRAFERPGKLEPGWDVTELEDSVGVLAVQGTIVDRAGSLYMLDADSTDLYLWNSGTGQWGAATTLTGPANGASDQAVADHNSLYWHERMTDNVWKWTSGTAATQIDSGGMTAVDEAFVTAFGAYVYVYDPVAGHVWEIAKSGATETLIDDFSDDPGRFPGAVPQIVRMDGKLYVLVNRSDHTVVREITPTTAAGTGFGAEIARFPGFGGHAIWAHSGTLYIFGRYGAANEATVLYLSPGGQYGSLGRVRIDNHSAWANSGEQASEMLSHYFVLSDGTNTHVFEIAAVSGGFAKIAEINDADFQHQAVLFDEHGLFWANATGGDRSYRADPDGYATSSYAISPWHDFSIAEEKILSSLSLSVEDLPADWTVYVDYAINGKDTWTTVITYNTTNGNGTKATVSTNSSTVLFGTVSVRIRMEYGGVSDPPTSGPVVLGVDVGAQIAKPQREWNLLLDLSDRRSRHAQESGARKIDNLLTVAHGGNVVEFVDKYTDRSSETSYDVVVDDYMLALSTKGEGVGRVTLKEVS